MTNRRITNSLLIALLTALIFIPRLTDMGGYAIVDEPDRWRWAEDFALALYHGDLAGTLVTDGYPGITPVWVTNLSIYSEMVRRSLRAGEWIGYPGLINLLHQWERIESLHWQRLPIVLFNSVVAGAIIGMVWRLYGRTVGVVAGVLIALDPFYLSDSRVNRAEAFITGLMTLSILMLIGYAQTRRYSYVILSGLLGGLSLLTKIQALVMLPAVGLIGWWIAVERFGDSAIRRFNDSVSQESNESPNRRIVESLNLLIRAIPPAVQLLAVWLVMAGLVWFTLWPAMWVIPLETLELVYSYTTRKVGAEGINLFFWGQTYRDADLGWLFYPYVFLLRLTPLTLLGLIAWGWVWRNQLVGANGNRPQRGQPAGERHSPLHSYSAVVPLLIYIIAYSVPMSVGSHKQDRYLLPIFLAVNIIAAIGWVGAWQMVKARWPNRIISTRSNAPASEQSAFPRRNMGTSRPKGFQKPFGSVWAGTVLALFIGGQLLTIWPHHPYYYSYFNPVFGGGWTAQRTLRVGWGEGMDQVAAYLMSKPNGKDLVVSTRFTHNMVGFKGETISLLANGRWTQADYIVLYIQHAQRNQEPSSAFFDYFRRFEPEKVVTIGGIEYAKIYPIPFSVGLNPQISQQTAQLALFGYRWEGNELMVLWENFVGATPPMLQARLTSTTSETEWATCAVQPDFVEVSQTVGGYVESACAFDFSDLSAGVYTVEFAVNGDLLNVPEGWQAVLLDDAGAVRDTTLVERLEFIARQNLPAEVVRTERMYGEQTRLLGYQLEPVQPAPGDSLTVTLYWQTISAQLEPLHLTVQVADSRQINLGRFDKTLQAQNWLPGSVVPTQHQFELPSELDDLLGGQVEVTLYDPAEVALSMSDGQGKGLDHVVSRFTIARTEASNTSVNWTPADLSWDNGLSLNGYQLDPTQFAPNGTLNLALNWATSQPITQSYVSFIHLIDQNDQIIAQNDALPRAGAYPIPWWQPTQNVSEFRQLTLPAELPPPPYRLRFGWYVPDSFERLEGVYDVAITD